MGSVGGVKGGWITEIKYFYTSQSCRPVSAEAQALWHYLMYRANAAFWQMPLVLQSAEIEGAVKLSESSFKRARKVLEENGYLMVEAQGGRRQSHYYLLSCVSPGKVLQPAKILKDEPDRNALVNKV